MLDDCVNRAIGAELTPLGKIQGKREAEQHGLLYQSV